MRWGQAATEQIRGAFLGENRCCGTFGGLNSAAGVVSESRERVIWERSDYSLPNLVVLLLEPPPELDLLMEIMDYPLPQRRPG
jgi:hypothetical protein